MIRLIIELLLILFTCSAPSAAGCSCGSGGSAGYNFLGDPSFDIDMTSFDEFSQAAYVANTVEEPTSYEIGSIKKAGPKEDKDNISIDLDDGSRIDLVLHPAGDDLFGRGDMILGSTGASEALGVVGVREGDRLIMDMVSLSGDLYRVDLREDEHGFSGDFVKITHDGETARGNANGGFRAKSASMHSSPAQTSS